MKTPVLVMLLVASKGAASKQCLGGSMFSGNDGPAAYVAINCICIDLKKCAFLFFFKSTPRSG